MIELRAAQARGYADHGWLKSFHSFSFADYHDPAHMGFGPLRVINDDMIAPNMGFGTHGHRDMEIITYVLEGALAHKDSMGNGSTILPGNVQRMSAGSGVRHSEFNHGSQTTHLLQIWIEPNVIGIVPSYEEKNFSAADKRGRLCLIADAEGAEGAVKIHQNAKVYAALLDGAETIERTLDTTRLYYIHVATGRLIVNDQQLHAGDALKISASDALVMRQGEHAEVLMFDLPVVG